MQAVQLWHKIYNEQGPFNFFKNYVYFSCKQTLRINAASAAQSAAYDARSAIKFKKCCFSEEAEYQFGQLCRLFQHSRYDEICGR
jgi:hypothetical protein